MALARRYKERDRIIRSLGYGSYSEYLSSDLWHSIRTRAMRRDGCRCRKCRRPATEVHHIAYPRETMMGLESGMRWLKSLCRVCHERAEKKIWRSISVSERVGITFRVREASGPDLARLNRKRQAARDRMAELCENARMAQLQRKYDRETRLKFWSEFLRPYLLPSMRRAMAGESGCWPAYVAQT